MRNLGGMGGIAALSQLNKSEQLNKPEQKPV